MSSPGIVIDGINGQMTQAECDRLHFLKNKPSLPEVNGLPIEFAPYTYQPYPRALYGVWTDETKLKALRDIARQRGLDLQDEYDYREAVAHLHPHDTKLVTTEREHAYWTAKGWADAPGGVEAAQQALEEGRSTAEAHRNWEDRHLSEPAKAEVLAVRTAAEDFVPEVPETPIKRSHHAKPKPVGADHV